MADKHSSRYATASSHPSIYTRNKKPPIKNLARGKTLSPTPAGFPVRADDDKVLGWDYLYFIPGIEFSRGSLQLRQQGDKIVPVAGTAVEIPAVTASFCPASL